MLKTTFFNAHHSPIGAFSTLTLGMKGARGGLGLELGGPADKAVYIGVEERERPGLYRALPFYQTDQVENSEGAYDVEGLGDFHRARAISPFEDTAISREMGPSIDQWTAGDLTFRLISPVRPVPDPASGDPSSLREAVAPAILAELTIDNRGCARRRKAFFGYEGGESTHAMRLIQENGLVGVAQGLSTAIATTDGGVYGGLAFQPESILSPLHPSNLGFMIGGVGLLVGEVEPGEVRTFRFAVGFFREGTATTGISTRYLYRRWFDRVEDVVKFALENFEASLLAAEALDARVSAALRPERALMLSHAIRSYFGSTQLLERTDGSPLWVVNEGEYRMMNTFDLAIDQAFFELALNPWTVRNELDLFTERYSYQDKARLPTGAETFGGGLAFTHDMGVANSFSPPGTSSYEQAGLRGCFSFMSCEELMNWAVCAALYYSQTGDIDWLRANANTFEATVTSLMNRDHPDPQERNGVMGLDGARCNGGSEITTYDSLDASLGQARNNLYLAVKGWSVYVLLGPILTMLDRIDLVKAVAAQAEKCSSTVVAAQNEGLLPAVIGEGVEARIIPAIEGLVYPWVTGQDQDLSLDGPFGPLVSTVTNHLKSVLHSGVCRFADGGWRLSSTSRNSWLSKIYLCQAIAEQILGETPDEVADQAHLSWLMDTENAYYAWSDQMVEGKAVGSRYYPRGVTAALWLAKECERPIYSIRKTLVGDNGNNN